jgi:hypothetical protein
METSSRLIPLVDDLTHILIEAGKNDYTDAGYREYFIDGSALMVRPVSPDWYVAGSVLVPGQFQRFTVDMKKLAKWFGLEIARLMVDECLSHRES